MIALTSPLVWYSTRATGTVALVLLTAAMVLGILTAVRAGSTALPRFAVSDLHRRVSLVAGIFVLLHVATAVVDTFVPLGWPSLVVPFTSHYRPFWVGTGTIAFDLLVAVTATSLLRRYGTETPAYRQERRRHEFGPPLLLVKTQGHVMLPE